MESAPPKIVLVGAGRVAWQLGKRLRAKGLPVAQVLSRTPEHAESLAATLRAPWSAEWSAVRPDVDWLILAVRDDVIGEVAAQLARYVPSALATHTSGSTPGQVLAPHFARCGVFYPLQSFSLERIPVWSKIPFCIDARTEPDVIFLKKMAKIIGNLVYRVDDAQRAQLHVAAVFANNFSNHCFSIAEKILAEKGLAFEMLHPLLEETVAKALQQGPEMAQTGPAKRGDAATVVRQLQQLEAHPQWQSLYGALSRDINPDLGDSKV